MVNKSTKRVLSMKVLPGEPTDGSGKVSIHLFVPDERGPFTEPCVSHMANTEKGKQLSQKAMRGRLACDKKRTVVQTTIKGVTSVTLRTDDPRAVTCKRCEKSVEYVQMMEQLNRT